MQNNEITIGTNVAIHKTRGLGFRDLTVYGQISGVRKHWNGNPDLLEVQVEGLEIWIALDDSVQIMIHRSEDGENNDCN